MKTLVSRIAVCTVALGTLIAGSTADAQDKVRIRLNGPSLGLQQPVSPFVTPGRDAVLPPTSPFVPPQQPGLRTIPGPNVNPIYPPVQPNPWVAPRPTRTMGFLGTFEWNRGMRVNQVFHGSLAQRIGLERGDLILAMNGVRIAQRGDYERLVDLSPRHFNLAVQCIRSGRVVNVAGVFLGGCGNQGPGWGHPQPYDQVHPFDEPFPTLKNSRRSNPRF